MGQELPVTGGRYRPETDTHQSFFSDATLFESVFFLLLMRVCGFATEYAFPEYSLSLFGLRLLIFKVERISLSCLSELIGMYKRH